MLVSKFSLMISVLSYCANETLITHHVCYLFFQTLEVFLSATTEALPCNCQMGDVNQQSCFLVLTSLWQQLKERLLKCRYRRYQTGPDTVIGYLSLGLGTTRINSFIACLYGVFSGKRNVWSAKCKKYMISLTQISMC